MVLVVKNMPAKQETQFDPWARKSPWRGNGPPFRYELGDKYSSVKNLASSLSTCVSFHLKEYLTLIRPLPFTACTSVQEDFS